jgi:hypothetical protein
MKKLIISSLFLGTICLSASAQSGTNSPYSQYGLGILSDQSQGFNRGMNGLGIGLRNGNQVNYLNPASYSSIDSLTMLVDMGLSLQLTNFKEKGNKVNARNANFDYVVASFRLFPKFGLAAGVVPFTNIGYNYSFTEKVGTSTTTTTQTYNGDGGLHQVFLGFGWNPFAGLSLGANASYLWGTYHKVLGVTSNSANVNNITKEYYSSISSYKIDLGLQWEQKIGKNDAFVIGATMGLRHKLGADASVSIKNVNSQTGVSQSSADTVSNAFSIPLTIGGGMSYRHGNKWLVGVDYSLQKWGELDFPRINSNTQRYELASGLLRDRSKFTVGGEWTPRAYDMNNLFNRIHYRVGASYATPYYNIGDVKGPSEVSVSAGFGIPIFNTWNNRSLLNISAQWTHVSAKDMITENTFRINVGLTFNERWFQKWKVK